MHQRGVGVKDHIEELKNKFGHSNFRTGQLECVEAALAGRDVFCLMPTGGGKSVVYQLPAWCCHGVCVVFSPLVSLIVDQVDAMNDLGVLSCYFAASSDEGESRDLYSKLFRYEIQDPGSESDRKLIKMLYITPEKFAKSETLKNLLKSLDSKQLLSRFVIDEAHCMSSWGHDFRPDYLSLSRLRQEFPEVPIMALTATANRSVVHDSIKIIGMRSPFLHTMSFNRTNLNYYVRKKEGNAKLIKDITEIIRSRRGQSGIIYCLSKKDTEELAEKLQGEIVEMQDQITYYHADVRPEVKEARQRAWSKGSIKLICATIAFGMGINKPDVRYIIHHSLPKSLTNYYQESGRAGRDGEPSDCFLFFSYRDKGKIQHMIVKGYEDRGVQNKGNSENKKLQIDNLSKCTSYCSNEVECRRVLLLEYFGENFRRQDCNNTCDNCLRGGTVEMVDFSPHAVAAISMIREIKSRNIPSVTLIQLCKIYSGSKDKDMLKFSGLTTKPHGALTRDQVYMYL